MCCRWHYPFEFVCKEFVRQLQTHMHAHRTRSCSQTDLYFYFFFSLDRLRLLHVKLITFYVCTLYSDHCLHHLRCGCATTAYWIVVVSVGGGGGSGVVVVVCSSIQRNEWNGKQKKAKQTDLSVVPYVLQLDTWLLYIALETTSERIRRGTNTHTHDEKFIECVVVIVVVCRLIHETRATSPILFWRNREIKHDNIHKYVTEIRELNYWPLYDVDVYELTSLANHTQQFAVFLLICFCEMKWGSQHTSVRKQITRTRTQSDWLIVHGHVCVCALKLRFVCERCKVEIVNYVNTTKTEKKTRENESTRCRHQTIVLHNCNAKQ